MYVYHSIAPRRFKIEICHYKIVCYCISNRVRFLIELHEFSVYSTPLENIFVRSYTLYVLVCKRYVSDIRILQTSRCTTYKYKTNST